MPAGYRCILIAVVGWLSLAAQTPQHRTTEPQGSTDNHIAAALENVAASLSSNNEPSHHDQPCGQGSDNRKSDLCAQWKAADAAESTAEAAWLFGYFGTSLGLLTLTAAGAAAWYARKAAIHTEESAAEAKRAADAAEGQLAEARQATRPYVAAIAQTFTLVGNEFRCRLEFTNSGKSPVQQATFRSNSYFLRNDGASRPLRVSNWPHGTMAPGAPLYLDCRFSLEQSEMDALRANRAEVRMDVTGRYSNDLGERWIVTLPLYIDALGLDAGEIFSNAPHHQRVDEDGSKANHQPTLDLEDGG